MKRIISTIILAFALCAGAFAADGDAPDPQQRPAPHRPKVGVVLSGGGAKGMAHIGVLKMLEELEIPVDYIVGTSIGSIIGGLYALGYSADELDSLVRSQDWNWLMKDRPERRDIYYEDKKVQERCVAVVPFLDPDSFKSQLGKNEQEKKSSTILANLPSALVQGQNLYSLFTKLSVGYQDSIDFNTLPIPFACVAVDLNTKSEVVFHGGSIVEALRASMSIPGYFSPVQKDDMFLVDGGLLNNFPVDVVRAMGAETVIGSDLHYLRRSQEKSVETLPEMFGSFLSIMNGEKYWEGRRNADVLINPDTRAYGVLSFDSVSLEALIDSGYVAASKVRSTLEMLAASQKDLARREAEWKTLPSREEFHPSKAVDLGRDSVYISQISISGTDSDNIRKFLERAGIAPGMSLDGDKLDDVVSTLYNTGDYSKVLFSVKGDEAFRRLEFELTPSMKHQVGIGFRFDSEEMASLWLEASIGKHKMHGWKLDAAAKLAQSPIFSVNLGLAAGNWLQFNLGYRFRSSRTSLLGYGSLAGVSDNMIHGPEFNVELRHLRNADLKISAGLMFHDVKDIDTRTLPDYEPATGNNAKGMMPVVKLRYDLDNFDRSYFPNRGVRLSAEAGAYSNVFAEELAHFFSAALSLEGIVPLGSRVALVPKLNARWIFTDDEGTVPYIYSNLAGGYLPGRYVDQMMPLVGVNGSFVAGRKASVARIDLRVNTWGNQYLTLIANGLLGFDELEDLAGEGNYMLVGGLGLGYHFNTVIGPVGLNVHWNDANRKVGVYASIGYDF